MIQLDRRLSRTFLFALEAGGGYAEALRITAGSARDWGPSELADELEAHASSHAGDLSLELGLGLQPAIAGQLIAATERKKRSEAARHILLALPVERVSRPLEIFIGLLPFTSIPLALGVLAVLNTFISPVFEKMFADGIGLVEPPSDFGGFVKSALWLGAVLLLISIARKERTSVDHSGVYRAVPDVLHWFEAAHLAGWSALEAVTRLHRGLRSTMLGAVAKAAERSKLGPDASFDEVWALVGQAVREPELGAALRRVADEIGTSLAVERLGAYLRARPAVHSIPVFLYAGVSVSALGMMAMILGHYNQIFLLPATLVEGWPR
jgi:hypothetical protein